MTAHTLRDEARRRAALATFRQSAARAGYRGRVSMSWDDLHGRVRYMVRVSIFP